MTDPLDLDAIEALDAMLITALVVELRTARAERDRLDWIVTETADGTLIDRLTAVEAERDALVGRIEAATHELDLALVTASNPADLRMVILGARAALSGARVRVLSYGVNDAAAPKDGPLTITIPGMPVKPGDVLRFPVEYDSGLDLWCLRVATSWDLGTERGWRIGWYLNEDGVPTSRVATTWVAP